MNRIKILHVIGTMDMGGAETFLMNILRSADRHRFKFIFLCFENKQFDYEKELVTLGAKVVRIPDAKRSGPIRHIRDIIQILRAESVDIIHSHTYYNSMFALIAGKLSGTKVRITHSHNTRAENSPSIVKNIYFRISSIVINTLSTSRIACGQDAGKALFGHKSFLVITNGIKIQDFVYSTVKRSEIREELGINNDETVLLNIARFSTQKNHDFLIDIYCAYIKSNPKSKLILVGDGHLRRAIERKVEKLGISQKVIFAGKRSDTSSLYSSADLFILPSLYEGLPVTMVEAQANGLPSVISDSIDNNVKLTNTVMSYSLSKSAKQWANMINKLDLTRRNTEKILKSGSYDVDESIKVLERLYTTSLLDKRAESEIR